MSPGRSLLEGAEVARYTIGGVVGRGGTAVVYRATHPDRDDPVALKLIDPARWGPDLQALLERESRLASAVAHRHILPVYEAGRENGRPFVAMQLAPHDLASVLRQEGRLDPTRAVRCVAQVGSGLDAAHAHGLVHRDIKPSNVLLGTDDGAEHAYLADFGVSRAAFSTGDVLGADLVGTVGYLSPEQIRGEPLDGRADVYSLGCLLYECLVGWLPFRRPTAIATLWAHLHEEPTPPSVLVPALPPDLDRVVLRALAKEPHTRYGSAGSLADAALEAVGGRRSGKPPVSARARLPNGTVTFLAAEVHGSAHVQRGLGEDADGLARALREACAAHGGVETDCRGDVLLFAFGEVSRAVEAASAFASVPGGSSRVRVGLHTGTPHLTSEGYVGADLERAVEIASCGHGGQVLLAGATAERLEPSNTVSQALVHLGAHRLTRFDEPVTLFQLGDGSFPPLKTVATTNLPTPPTSFVGRTDELDDAAGLLLGTRMLTVTAPGGAGKTRFALELARRTREERFSDYPDGVFACFFASLRDPALALPTIAQALSIREDAGTGVLESLASHLEGRRVLLVCDNLEHMLAATRELTELLDACPGLTLLCTSREALRVKDEAVYALPPFADDEAVALFCERARVEPNDTIRELCVRLEGLPLAIELAAARLELLSPDQLLARLAQRLDVLRARSDADPRQETLRATIQWSYDLLDEPEQRLLARLSIFANGCTLEAAEEIAGADLDTLQALIDKSLVRREKSDLGPRFSMLETIREFAEEALRDSGECEDLAARRQAFFLRLASEIASVRWGTSELEDRQRFEADRPNFLSVLSRATERHDAEIAFRLLRLLGDHLHTSAGHSESLGLARATLGLVGGDEADRAHASLHASRLAAELGLVEEFRSHSEAAEATFARLEDERGLWQVLQERAHYEMVYENHACAVHAAERALSIGQAARAPGLEMIATAVLAAARVEAQLAGDAPDSVELARALELHERALAWARAEGSAAEQRVAIGNHAHLLSIVGEDEAALRVAQECLRVSIRERVSPAHLVEIMLTIGRTAARLDAGASAAALMGFSLRELRREGRPLPPTETRRQAATEALLREAIGDDAYERAVGDGERLAPDAAVELALRIETKAHAGTPDG